MIVVPNYTVVVPVTPELRLSTPWRVDNSGDRGEHNYSISVDSTAAVSVLTLPWTPVAPEWVEVYVDGSRLVNPRVTGKDTDVNSITARTLYQAFNVVGRKIHFATPVSGDIKIICDTKATPWWGGLKIDIRNFQGNVETTTMSNIIVNSWNIIGGHRRGFKTVIEYDVGPQFFTNSNITISGCSPDAYNGANIQIVDSTFGSITFNANSAGVDFMTVKGNISGFAPIFTTNIHTGVSLYCEPVVLTQPYNGYARLSADRRSIVYVPNFQFVGQDTFSWATITQHGQVSEPQCVYIKVLPGPTVHISSITPSSGPVGTIFTANYTTTHTTSVSATYTAGGNTSAVVSGLPPAGSWSFSPRVADTAAKVTLIAYSATGLKASASANFVATLPYSNGTWAGTTPQNGITYAQHTSSLSGTGVAGSTISFNLEPAGTWTYTGDFGDPGLRFADYTLSGTLTAGTSMNVTFSTTGVDAIYTATANFQTPAPAPAPMYGEWIPNTPGTGLSITNLYMLTGNSVGGTSISYTLTPGLIWTIAGPLDPGLSFDVNTGVLIGTLTSGFTTNTIWTATDQASNTYTAIAVFSVT